MLEPTTRSLTFALIFYAAAAGFLVRAVLLREWQIAPLKEVEFQPLDVSSRRVPLLFLLPLLLISFFAFSGNRFTTLNLILWLVLILAAFAAFWIPRQTEGWEHFKENVSAFSKTRESTYVSQVGICCSWR